MIKSLCLARSCVVIKITGLTLSLIFSLWSQAADAPMPPEFWLYLSEYGNEKGEVFDPADFSKAGESVKTYAASSSASSEAQQQAVSSFSTSSQMGIEKKGKPL